MGGVNLLERRFAQGLCRHDDRLRDLIGLGSSAAVGRILSGRSCGTCSEAQLKLVAADRTVSSDPTSLLDACHPSRNHLLSASASDVQSRPPSYTCSLALLPCDSVCSRHRQGRHTCCSCGYRFCIFMLPGCLMLALLPHAVCRNWFLGSMRFACIIMCGWHWTSAKFSPTYLFSVSVAVATLIQAEWP